MPNDDDKFDPFASDKTVILPNPGGTSKPGASAQMANAQNPQNTPQGRLNNPIADFKLPKPDHLSSAEQNCILGNSLAIIGYAAQLRHLSGSPDPGRLFNEFVVQIKEIGENLRVAGQADEVIVTARYLICSFVDEMVLNTPWGASSHWSTQSLLSFFHKESQGGTKFFEILNKIEQQSARFIDLIELVYVCLSYGYQGKYRFQPDGISQISSIQENLYQHIRQIRQHQEMPLSAVTEGIDTKSSALTQGKALLLTASLSLVILMFTYGALLFSINDESDPIASQTLLLKQAIPALIEKKRSVAQPAQTAPLELLANDLAQGSIDIEATPAGPKFILFGDGLFDSGSAYVINRDLVKRVAEVVKQINGAITVTGHTDNVPIRTMEFPSNLHLSKKRAGSIANLLRENLAGRTIRVEGLADLQPLVPNTNKQNQAKNRRVEILLFSN